MEDGERVVVHVETLTHGWDSTRGTVFELEETLVEQLTELAHAQGHRPTRTPAVAVTNEAEGEEGWDQAANQVRQVETRETLVEAVRTGVAPVGRRPERQCRRVEAYGR